MSTVGDDFASVAEPFRRELLAHCYQMLGSVQDAEDMVQETMLRAWHARDRYDQERASLRTWLHRIAANRCLTALETRARRPLPSGLGAPSDDPEQPLVPALDVAWLQPLPDALVAAGRDDPVARLMAKGRMRLALVAAMQALPPRQRAVLILRDVLEFSAAEVAGMLGTSTAAVNSALQRAHARVGGGEPADIAAGALAAEEVELVDRYVAAFERADVPALTELLSDAAVLEMPPVPLWFAGKDDYRRFMERLFRMRGGDWRVCRVRANGQPAMAAYVGGGDGEHRLHTVQVLSGGAAGIARNVVFQDPVVFALFDLPPTLAG